MKIGIKTFFRNSGLALLSAALIFACSSCEIGLGAAVDTDAPMVDSILAGGKQCETWINRFSRNLL